MKSSASESVGPYTLEKSSPNTKANVCPSFSLNIRPSRELTRSTVDWLEEIACRSITKKVRPSDRSWASASPEEPARTTDRLSAIRRMSIDRNRMLFLPRIKHYERPHAQSTRNKYKFFPKQDIDIVRNSGDGVGCGRPGGLRWSN